MSWKDKINSTYQITCGDGQVYKPLWFAASKVLDFNIAEYEFPNLEGTLVTRGKSKGVRYNLEIVFQGDNNLDDSDKFQKSSKDNRAWTIQHPMYGVLTVQPISLSFDNSSFNVTKVTGIVVETIIADTPKTNISNKDKINSLKSISDAKLNDSFTAEVSPKLVDINKINTNSSLTYAEGLKKISNSLDAETYYNAFKTANTFMNGVLSKATAPADALSGVQNLINAPVNFADSMQTKLDLFTLQYTHLRSGISNAMSRAFKKIYEHNAGTLITAMAQTTATVLFGNRKSILDTVSQLLDTHTQYLADLDLIQDTNGGNISYYIPSHDSLFYIDQTINLAISNLYSQLATAKQERIIYLPSDTNVINLAYQIYGLQIDDSTIDILMNDNDIYLSEILQLQKGRKIVYYI